MTTEQRTDRTSNGAQEHLEREDSKDEIAGLRCELEVQAISRSHLMRGTEDERTLGERHRLETQFDYLSASEGTNAGPRSEGMTVTSSPEVRMCREQIESSPGESLRTSEAGAIPLTSLTVLVDLWPILTQEEVDATRGRPELVSAILRSKIGYAERIARDAMAGFPEQALRRRALSGRSRMIGALATLGALTAFVLPLF